MLKLVSAMLKDQMTTIVMKKANALANPMLVENIVTNVQMGMNNFLIVLNVLLNIMDIQIVKVSGKILNFWLKIIAFLYQISILAACECNAEGSTSTTCDADGQCNCKPNISGPKCDITEPGFYNFPDPKGLHNLQKVLIAKKVFNKKM